jgi:putative protein kinase ArgK-like GTPase of G3E family
VLLTSARDQVGIEALVDQIETHRRTSLASGRLEQRRIEGSIAFAIESLVRRYGEYGLERIGGLPAVERSVVRAPSHSPFRVVLEVGRAIERALDGK